MCKKYLQKIVGKNFSFQLPHENISTMKLLYVFSSSLRQQANRESRVNQSCKKITFPYLIHNTLLSPHSWRNGWGPSAHCRTRWSPSGTVSAKSATAPGYLTMRTWPHNVGKGAGRLCDLFPAWWESETAPFVTENDGPVVILVPDDATNGLIDGPRRLLFVPHLII